MQEQGNPLTALPNKTDNEFSYCVSSVLSLLLLRICHKNQFNTSFISKLSKMNSTKSEAGKLLPYVKLNDLRGIKSFIIPEEPQYNRIFVHNDFAPESQNTICAKISLTTAKLIERKPLEVTTNNPSHFSPARKSTDSQIETLMAPFVSKLKNLSIKQKDLQKVETKTISKVSRIAKRVANEVICGQRFRQSTLKNRKAVESRKKSLKSVSLKDGFDEPTMKIIRQKLHSIDDFETGDNHDCIFQGEIMCRRTHETEEPNVFVHWHPEMIFPDEWIPESQFQTKKIVPLHQIPSDKIKLLYPQMFPSNKQGKTPRKYKSSAKLVELPGKDTEKAQIHDMEDSFDSLALGTRQGKSKQLADWALPLLEGQY